MFFEIYQGTGTAPPSVLFGSYANDDLAYTCPKIKLDCDANPEGCITILFAPDNSLNPGDKGAGWKARVRCVDRMLMLECPSMQMIPGQFIETGGNPSCNIQGSYTIPTPAQAEDSECIDENNITFTVDIDLNDSDLEIIDVNEGDLEVGDEILIIADDANEIGNCIKLNYIATCNGSEIVASCSDIELCLFAPSLVTSAKKVGLSDECKAIITPQVFVGDLCDLLTYTLNVFDEDGMRIGDEDAAVVLHQ